MTTLTSQQIDLVRRVRDRIAADPAGFDQEDWGGPLKTPEPDWACGTPACLAGHVLHVLHERGTAMPWQFIGRLRLAADAVGLPDANRVGAGGLPDLFRGRPEAFAPGERWGCDEDHPDVDGVDGWPEPTAEQMVGYLSDVIRTGRWWL